MLGERLVIFGCEVTLGSSFHDRLGFFISDDIVFEDQGCRSLYPNGAVLYSTFAAGVIMKADALKS